VEPKKGEGVEIPPLTSPMRDVRLSEKPKLRSKPSVLERKGNSYWGEGQKGCPKKKVSARKKNLGRKTKGTESKPSRQISAKGSKPEGEGSFRQKETIAKRPPPSRIVKGEEGGGLMLDGAGSHGSVVNSKLSSLRRKGRKKKNRKVREGNVKRVKKCTLIPMKDGEGGNRSAEGKPMLGRGGGGGRENRKSGRPGPSKRLHDLEKGAPGSGKGTEFGRRDPTATPKKSFKLIKQRPNEQR